MARQFNMQADRPESPSVSASVVAMHDVHYFLHNPLKSPRAAQYLPSKIMIDIPFERLKVGSELRAAFVQDNAFICTQAGWGARVFGRTNGVTVTVPLTPDALPGNKGLSGSKVMMSVCYMHTIP